MIKFSPADYLYDNDLEKIKLIKIIVRNATTIEEIWQCNKEMERLIKKAYLRYKMGNKLR